MTTVGSFNVKNPTIKRILKEASELANNPSPDFHAAPLDTNLFEWHFTLRGPPSSPFSAGIYHGRIVLPSTYPLRPPSFRFLTPSGRFEVNREICLSISGHHEESWQPAWGVRTALVALRSFMETDVAGQVGGLQSDKETRRQLAERSRVWCCAACGGAGGGGGKRTNAQIMREVEAAVADRDGGADGESATEQVPAELRLAYREDLGSKPSSPTTTVGQRSVPSTPTTAQGQSQVLSSPRTVRRSRPQPDAWIDKAIYIIGGLLAFLVLRKVIAAIA